MNGWLDKGGRYEICRAGKASTWSCADRFPSLWHTSSFFGSLSQKQNSIRSMDAIYGAVFATIVLTVPSRQHLEQGLPICSAPRIPCQHVKTVGNRKLASTFPSLRMTIMTSERVGRSKNGILSYRCILPYSTRNKSTLKGAETASSEPVQEPSQPISMSTRPPHPVQKPP